MIGITIGYDLELKYINYQVKAPLKIQVLKYAIGIVIALFIKKRA